MLEKGEGPREREREARRKAGRKGKGGTLNFLPKRSGVTHLKRSDADVRDSLTCYVLISIPL